MHTFLKLVNLQTQRRKWNHDQDISSRWEKLSCKRKEKHGMKLRGGALLLGDAHKSENFKEIPLKR
jgi:hypothetical protein